MGKKLLLFSVAIILIMSLNAVSAFYFYPQHKIDDFRETTEFSQTTEHKIGDYWNYETTKTTITEKTEIRKVKRTPYYYDYPRSYRGYVPYSSWRFKEPYDHSRYVDAYYNDYYYKPRYDSTLGYYNWRW